MSYQPIEDYGIIKKMWVKALVGNNGSIDWFYLSSRPLKNVFEAGDLIFEEMLNYTNHQELYAQETETSDKLSEFSSGICFDWR